MLALSDFGLLDQLKAGDQAAFCSLVRRHNHAMTSIAHAHVGNWATAEEVVQQTWLIVIASLSRFDGRSTLKTWIFGILVNVARARVRCDRKSIPFTDLGIDAVDPSRFIASGQWADPPDAWGDLTPERIVGGRELIEHMAMALDALPPTQRSVVILRDLEGLDAEEASKVLGVSEGNQRVLLHRARSRLRSAMENLLGSGARRHIAAGTPGVTFGDSKASRD
jgi:RNA polymerase sigma-70 factor (ECF subfamily)